MSGFSKVPISKLVSSSNFVQKSTAGLGTFTKKLPWEPCEKDRWSSSKDKEYKPMSTMTYAHKLQCEEDLRTQTKPFQVPMSQIVKQLPKRKSWKVIYDEL